MSSHEVIPLVVEVHDGPPPKSAAGDHSRTKQSTPNMDDMLLPFVAGVAFGVFGLVLLGLTLADAASRTRTLRDEGGDD